MQKYFVIETIEQGDRRCSGDFYFLNHLIDSSAEGICILNVQLLIKTLKHTFVLARQH